MQYLMRPFDICGTDDLSVSQQTLLTHDATAGAKKTWTVSRKGILLTVAACVVIISACGLYFALVWDPCAHLMMEMPARRQSGGHKLRFKDDGTFKILQLTDLHIRCWPDTGGHTLATINALLDAEKPEFVAYTGDICEGSFISCQKPQHQATILRAAFYPTEKRGLPWAFIYGNWDRKPEAFWIGSEINSFISNNFAYSMNALPPENVDGDSVFDIHISPPNVSDDSDSLGFVLYFFDTHANDGCGDLLGTGCLHPSEVQWYNKRAAAYFERNGGRAVPAFGFLHIPIPEYLAAWNDRKGTIGHLDEPGGADGKGISCVLKSNGLFDAMVSNGDMLGLSCGHDHDNDFSSMYKGISLMYGRKTGYGSYGPPTSWGESPASNGARVIELRYNGPSTVAMSTWIRLMDGTRIQDRGAETSSGHFPQDTCNHGS